MKNFVYLSFVCLAFVSLCGCPSQQPVTPEPVQPSPQPPVVVTPVEPVPAPPTQDNFVVENNCLVLPSEVMFVPHSDEVIKECMPVLAYVKSFLDAKSYVTMMRIEVHEAADGDEASALQKLSEERARSVARQLVSLGVDCQRLLPVGFGITKPVMDNTTAAGIKANRRVVFAIATMRGKPIGGMPVDGGGMMAGDPCQ